ncbi:26S proteasome subunit RPN4 [Apiospora kogelbergensis]|uniref:26S proteasome subunit RPN4 n=1 Tax=Apiospora kogelbergensis TaxID=1337665 RepID=A0AAW0QKR5_9PEZI
MEPSRYTVQMLISTKTLKAELYTEQLASLQRLCYSSMVIKYTERMEQRDQYTQPGRNEAGDSAQFNQTRPASRKTVAFVAVILYVFENSTWYRMCTTPYLVRHATRHAISESPGVLQTYTTQIPAIDSQLDDKPTNGMNSTPALNTMPLADSELCLVHYGLLHPYSYVNPVNMLGLGNTQSGTYSSEEYSLFSLMMPMVPASQTLLSEFPLSETFAEMPQAANDRNLDDCPPLPSVQSNPPFYQASLPTPSLRGPCEQPQNHSSPIDLEMKQDHTAAAAAAGGQSGTMPLKNIVFESNEPGQPDLFTFPFRQNDKLGRNQSSMCLDFQLSTLPGPTFPYPSLVSSSGLDDFSTVPQRLSKGSANGGMPLLQRRNRRSTHWTTTQNNTSRTGATRKEANGPCNSQATPYSCEKVNPGTGKPCKTTFSRPYDLTRHENSIHTHKKRIQCDLCIEEKTFSRADALTRHYRVCHPDTALTIKRRRRKTYASHTVGTGDKDIDRSQTDVVGKWFGQ